jgi:hypothetical protein
MNQKGNAGYYHNWTANLQFKNNTSSCVTKVEVELDLNNGGNILKKLVTTKFSSPLNPGELSQVQSVPFSPGNLKEDSDLVKWHVSAAWGFQMPK